MNNNENSHTTSDKLPPSPSPVTSHSSLRHISLPEIDTLLHTYKNKHIAIVTHQTPDGDGLAATLALSLCLIHIYHAHPYIVMDSTFPSFLDYLDYSHVPIHPFSSFRDIFTDFYDLLIVLDCHEESRVDTQPDIFKYAKAVLVIDHHIAKPENMNPHYLYYIDHHASTTGVIIHRWLARYFHSTDYAWKKDYADCIYTTIINDTDNFLNANTDAETFLVAADLCKLQFSPNIITNKLLYRKPISYFSFIGDVLSTIELHANHQIAFFYSTTEMLKKHDQNDEAYAKIMKWLKGTTDIAIQVFMGQYDHDFYRFSLRSERYNVATIAHHFGGGGHPEAAGFSFKGDFHTARSQSLQYIESQIIESPSDQFDNH